ncbi:antibiotic biosynthesis monooxygenase [Chitinophagaceae bacterium LB-8]|uniref:Antibiotic biosynthesis monooxygenase n=1 Tax=Paraflavisolibacter caeni TaxID=2982496 RepID=A0A9X3B8M6_9BACT|nr:antibiotic biosynthesis monooxygenase [Paraflavisolibacter caeni]MCU7550925.1 antibiotic biosynthesis monooxygenase [Paraflavisolibacter caeni]
MIVEYIRYKVEKDRRQEFIDAYIKASTQLNASEYCLAYEISECEEELGSFIVRIEWTSTDEHINGFRKSNVFPEFFTIVKPFFNDIQEMRHYKLTNINKRKYTP